MEELGGDQQVALAGPGPELHHVLQADPGLLPAAPSVHLVDEALGVALAELLSRHGPTSEPGREYGETGGGSNAARGETDIEKPRTATPPTQGSQVPSKYKQEERKRVQANPEEGWKWSEKAGALRLQES